MKTIATALAALALASPTLAEQPSHGQGHFTPNNSHATAHGGFQVNYANGGTAFCHVSGRVHTGPVDAKIWALRSYDCPLTFPNSPFGVHAIRAGVMEVHGLTWVAGGLNCGPIDARGSITADGKWRFDEYFHSPQGAFCFLYGEFSTNPQITATD